MKTITDIIQDYTIGKTPLEETNAALKEAGANFHLDPEKNTIAEDEQDRYGLLDTGTGTLDKVEIEDMQLKNMDCGEMYALCIFQGKTYRVKGRELVDKG